ncbi:sulfotransferase family protein [Aquipseudomonas campi]|uniref:Sulfotransferase family protein n=1 Tax=Aquipseudomonas campi TaxID=2731681 RepID=A0A6M8FMD5_9GAMM|nr:sulfotransferase family protein [Pseudomonas campi]QKE65039.1 sulfotransferase family protein [Pseudomonas campi]
MVVGMHRSGTSFLTGSLQQAGLELGNISAWNPHNLKGNRENLEIVAFNDEVLAARGFAWDNPPDAPVMWTEAEYARARQLIVYYDGVARWGFKDPRTLLLVEGWQHLLPELRFVGIFRHPTAVAQSLAARGEMPQEQAFALWLAYNKRLLKLYRQTKFPLLCFDEDEAVLHRKLDVVLDELGLEPSPERFFSADLKHHKQVRQPLPAELQKLYRELCRCAR